MAIKTYKGMDKDMKCRDFQYEVGKTYETDKAEACKHGFHACEMPLDVFNYYPPATSRFFEVEQDGELSRENGDSKVASTCIKIGAEIGIPGLVKAQFEYVRDRVTNEQNGGNYSALNGGDCSALKGGNYSALNGGNYSALKGGDYSALKGGYCSALNGGDCSALKGGNYSALNGGNYSALKGGDYSALKGGYYSVVYGGEGAKVCGGMWSVMAIQEWKDHKIVAVRTAVVDGETIKADTWYTLENGEFVEVE